MLKIKTPATTSNLGVGFDCLGMALNLYNVFTFEESKEFELHGFEKAYLDNNLVLLAYREVCESNGIYDCKAVRISLVQNEIPVARGLGSSASCIIAGALAANHFNNLNLDLQDIAKYCAIKEGHPDNVYACIYGGLVSVVKEENTYLFDCFNVSEKLNFGLMIPSVLGSTEALREILPNKIPLEDAVFNLSRIIHLPKAFKSGDMTLLSKVLKDKYHESYRSSHIENFDELKLENSKRGILQLISGSGPTIFLISNKKIEIVKSDLSNNYKFVSVEVSNGTESEVVL